MKDTLNADDDAVATDWMNLCAAAVFTETPLLNLINYASLMATNASRFRSVVGPKKTLVRHFQALI